MTRKLRRQPDLHVRQLVLLCVVCGRALAAAEQIRGSCDYCSTHQQRASESADLAAELERHDPAVRSFLAECGV